MADEFKQQLIAQLPALRAFALSLTRSGVDADDLVQEALLRAWRSRDTFRPGSSFKAWMFRILKNAFLSRRAAGRGRTMVGLDGPDAPQLASPPSQEWSLAFADTLEALGRLSPEAREALLLIVGSGLSYDEAAEVCRVPVGTIKSRVNRAREQLARMVDGELSARTAPRRGPGVSRSWRPAGAAGEGETKPGPEALADVAAEATPPLQAPLR